MKRQTVKVMVLAMATVVISTGNAMTVQATTTSSVLPVAGLSLALEDGASLNDIKPDSEIPIVTPTVSANAIEVAEEPVVVKTVVNEEEESFSSLVIAQVNDYVNIRSEPNTDSDILGKLYDDSVGELIEVEGDWYLMKSGTVTGYVKAEYVVTGEDAIELAQEVGTRFATVTTTTLFVREEPSTEATILGMIPIEEQLVALEEIDGWAKVSIEEGEGYASMDYLTMHTEFVEAESKEEEEARLEKEAADRAAANAAAVASQQTTTESSQTTTPTVTVSGSGMGTSVANFALQFVGNPYVYGGTSLTNGADCSGFVQSVYKNFGVSLPRTSSSQRSVGTDVGGIANAQPGDIVCYSGHVAIYIGNGQIVHASTTSTGIKVSNATYKTILSVRRIF